MSAQLSRAFLYLPPMEMQKMHTVLTIGGIILAVIALVFVMKALNWISDKWFHLEIFTWKAKRGLKIALILIAVILVLILALAK